MLGHREAAAPGLRIDHLPPEDDIWQRIWLLHCMFEYDCRKSNYLKMFEGNARSLALAAPHRPINQWRPNRSAISHTGALLPKRVAEGLPDIQRDEAHQADSVQQAVADEREQQRQRNDQEDR